MFDKRTICDFLNNGSELTADQSRRLRNLWKDASSYQRIDIFGSILNNAITVLVQDGFLGKDSELQLNKLLSLNISLTEALNLQVTNYLSFISHLIRARSNARGLLNLMSELIKNIEDKLHKQMEEQVVIYRSLQEDTNENNICIQGVNQRQIQEEDENSKYQEITQIEGSKAIKNEQKRFKNWDDKIPNFWSKTPN